MARRYLFNKSMNTYVELQGLSKAEKGIPYHPEAGHHYHQYNDQQIAHARADALDARDHFAKQAHQAETAGQHTKFRQAEEKYATQLDSLRAIRQWREKQSSGRGVSGMPNWYHEEYGHGSKKSFGKGYSRTGFLDDPSKRYDDYPLGDADYKPRKDTSPWGPSSTYRDYRAPHEPQTGKRLSAREREAARLGIVTRPSMTGIKRRRPSSTIPPSPPKTPGGIKSFGKGILDDMGNDYPLGDADYKPRKGPSAIERRRGKGPMMTLTRQGDVVTRTPSRMPNETPKSFRKAEFATAAGNKFKIPLPGDTRNIQEERPENRPGRVRPPVEKKPVMKTNRPFGFSAGPGPDAMTEDDYRRAKSKRK